MKTQRILTALVFAAGLTHGQAGMTRGPYLQMANPTAMTVRWRTDAAGRGVVRYGLTAGNLAGTLEEGAAVLDHELRLAGLAPATKYFYKIEVDNVTLASGSEYHFTTPPAAGSTAPFRFWALGDAGTGDEFQEAVRESFADEHAVKPADFIFMLGDNAYEEGADTEYQTAVFDMYPAFLRQLCLWSCLGNHETYANEAAPPYFDMFTLPAAGECGGVASGTEHFFSFNHGNVHFVVLDPEQSSRLADGAQAQWLAQDLQASTAMWTIAVFHHPPYTLGSHNSDYEEDLAELRTNIVPILEEGGVDLVLCGHSHAYERSWFMRGHYGMSDTFSPMLHQVQAGDGRDDGDGVYRKYIGGPLAGKGTVYVVCGCSGKTNGYVEPMPAMFTSQGESLGSMVIDVADKRMDVTFLRELPGVTGDHFTLLKKDGGPEVLPGTPDGLAALPLPGGSVLLRWDDVDAETSYEVQRSGDGVNFTTVGPVAMDVTFSEVDGLVTGMPVWLRVKARNDAGIAISAALSVTWLPPLNDPAGIERWRFVHFSTTASTGPAQDGADPDGDGRLNLMEYAVGSHPRQANPEPVLAGGYSAPDGAMRVTYRRLARPELTYIVEATSTMAEGDWQTLAMSTGAANIAGLVTVLDSGGAGAPLRFARLRVTRP